MCATIIAIPAFVTSSLCKSASFLAEARQFRFFLNVLFYVFCYAIYPYKVSRAFGQAPQQPHNSPTTSQNLQYFTVEIFFYYSQTLLDWLHFCLIRHISCCCIFQTSGAYVCGKLTNKRDTFQINC